MYSHVETEQGVFTTCFFFFFFNYKSDRADHICMLVSPEIQKKKKRIIKVTD